MVRRVRAASSAKVGGLQVQSWQQVSAQVQGAGTGTGKEGAVIIHLDSEGGEIEEGEVE